MKKQINNDKFMETEDFGLNSGAVSHTETTGLIPALAKSDYEIESYKEIDEYTQKPILRKEQDHNR